MWGSIYTTSLPLGFRTRLGTAKSGVGSGRLYSGFHAIYTHTGPGLAVRALSGCTPRLIYMLTCIASVYQDCMNRQGIDAGR